MRSIVCAIFVICCGCRAFYENSGSALAVGELTAPAEITEPSESFTLRLLFNMTGARVWTSRDAKVSVRYGNTYTNSYFCGLVDTVGRQDFDVKVEPLQVSPSE